MPTLLVDTKQIVKNIQKFNHAICAILKADAYGLGIENIVPVIEDYVQSFAVSKQSEYDKLKKITNKEIILLNSAEHLKINTGLNRFGINDFNEFIRKDLTKVKSVYTHFANVDNGRQDKIFQKFIQHYKRINPNGKVHAGCSDSPQYKYDFLRIGKAMYYGAVIVKSTIIAVHDIKKGGFIGYKYVAKRDMKIGVVDGGYYDFARIKKYVFVDEVRCKVIGRVCMDCFFIDLTDNERFKGAERSGGDEVIVLSGRLQCKYLCGIRRSRLAGQFR
ncbi:MAG: alanine racemase [Christensenellaceae bacterium]|jgi:alanine racemase|nr:alanine racemase [Christensenellaceae bacterium]